MNTDFKKKLLNDKNISKECKNIISNVPYSSILTLYENLKDKKKFDYIELFDTISTIMIFVEKIEVNKKKISGNEKKNLVLFIGRFFIQHNVKNQDFLNLYNKHAEEIIEKIIYSSVFLNTSSNIKKCCLSCF